MMYCQREKNRLTFLTCHTIFYTSADAVSVRFPTIRKDAYTFLEVERIALSV
jgi:hypothetical protein